MEWKIWTFLSTDIWFSEFGKWNFLHHRSWKCKEIHIWLVGCKIMQQRYHYFMECLHFWMNEFGWISSQDYLYVNHHLFLAIISHPTGKKHKFLYLHNQWLSKFHFLKFESCRSLGRNSQFFIPLRIQIKIDFHPTNTTIMLHSFRTLKWYSIWLTKIQSMVKEQQQTKNLLNRICNYTIL